MHKLVILIQEPDDPGAFDEVWPRFLHNVESMPELRREAASRVDAILYGNARYILMHELFFDSPDAARRAMSSPPGRAAGKLLQAMTGGKVILFLADHKEESLDNIRGLFVKDEPGMGPGLSMNSD